MAEDIHKPAGYCPLCEYPIDPGTCPECGRKVSPEKLVKSIGSVRRQRVARYGLLAAPFLLVLAIVVYVNVASDWVRRVPTTLLLPFQGDFNGDVSIELRRRFRLNQLTLTQAESIIEHHVDDPDLRFSRNHPPGVPIRITIQYQYRNDPSAIRPGSRSLGDLTLWVDGSEVTPMSHHDLEAVYSARPQSVHHEVWCPPLDVGRHQIVLEGDFMSGWKNSNGKTIVHAHHARLTGEITIEGDVFDRVAMIGTNALARQMRESIYAQFLPHSYRGPRLSFGLRSPHPLIVAGQVLVRRRGEVGFVHVGHVFLSSGSRSSVAVNLDALPGIETADWISVRVIPDPDVAFLRHADACFDGILMWQRVSASRDDGAVPSRSRFPSLPTQIVLNQTNGEVH